MAKFTDEQMEKGYTRFLRAHPSIENRIDGLTQAEADALGITLKELRDTETMRELQAIAKAKRVDSSDLFWSFVADTREEYDEMVAARDKAMKEAIGL